MAAAQIEVIHRPGDVEIAVGVEPFDEGGTLVAQVTLNLEVSLKTKGEIVPILKVAAKLTL